MSSYILFGVAFGWGERGLDVKIFVFIKFKVWWWGRYIVIIDYGKCEVWNEKEGLKREKEIG